MKAIVCACLMVLLCQQALAASRLREWKSRGKESRASKDGPQTLTLSIEEARQQIESGLRSKRAAPGSSSSNAPVIHGSHAFQDSNTNAIVHYSGSKSPVIVVLTYRLNLNDVPVGAKLYRSTDYGASFTSILENLDGSDQQPSIWNDFFVSPIDQNLIVIHHANQPKFYVSMDEGLSWTTKSTPSNINPRSFRWNSVNDTMALALDTTSHQLYVTSDLGTTWIKISDNVDSRNDYQWGDPDVDSDPTMVFFNTYNPSDIDRGDFTVSLQTQHSPFSNTTLSTFDPSLGKHDAFLLLGRYIYAQKTDSFSGAISLYVSYNRKPFKKALIPATDPHLGYAVSHIDQQQALVIVEHSSSQFNLYLSDLTGVYYSLSLPDIVQYNSYFDLELVEGVNGTLLANQYTHGDPTDILRRMRSLISLDNGGNWELVRSPASDDCIPPQCSLHFNMDTSAYYRTGIYSQASAPGILVAHGNTGRNLDSSNPDLYISRDGGVTWSLTLRGSWGITVADHGGLLVVAKDYHPPPSTSLLYSCDEGISWREFNFTNTSMTIYGVLTEPGEHTTTVSLYGQKINTNTWDVVTVNFSSIFTSTCSQADYYFWHPWDDRTDEECILGSTVTIERRNASRCCLIGEDYSRPIQFNICPCFEDDFECDYGYQHTDGFAGPCIRDNSIALPNAPCGPNQTTYTQSQGYRKVAGDVCSGGSEKLFAPVPQCCQNNDLCKSWCYSPSCLTTSSGVHTCVCKSSLNITTAATASDTCYSFEQCAAQCAPCSGPNTTVAPTGSTAPVSGGRGVDGTVIVVIVVSLLLALALCVILFLIILLIKKHVELKRSRITTAAGPIQYRISGGGSREEEQALAFGSQQDDDDEPLLT